MTPTSLTERIKARQPKVIELRRQPRWIERMNAGQTKAKDLTGFVNGSWTRTDQDGAA